MAITITAGHITSEAEAFMRTHGATIESTLGLLVVTLPEAAEIAYPIPGTGTEHAIDWDGELKAEWIAIDLDIDACKTRIRLKK